MRDKLKNRLKNWRRWLLPAAYALAVLLWLGLALAHFAADRARPEVPLDVATAATEELAALPEGAGRYLTEGVDPKFIFTGVEAKTRLVLLKADFERDPGELELFYTRREERGFEVRRRAIARPLGGGVYLYTLPAGAVRDLRLDAGTAAGNVVEVKEITLNPRLPAGFYFVPTARDLAALALGPALASCVIYTIIKGSITLRDLLQKRRKTLFDEG